MGKIIRDLSYFTKGSRLRSLLLSLWHFPLSPDPSLTSPLYVPLVKFPCCSHYVPYETSDSTSQPISRIQIPPFPNMHSHSRSPTRSRESPSRFPMEVPTSVPITVPTLCDPLPVPRCSRAQVAICTFWGYSSRIWWEMYEFPRMYPEYRFWGPQGHSHAGRLLRLQM